MVMRQWFRKATPEERDVEELRRQLLETSQQTALLLVERDELKRQRDSLQEELEAEQIKGRVAQIEIAELAALCANRLKRIEAGQVDYRERDKP